MECLKGKVKSVTSGAIDSKFIIELPGRVEMTSIITKTSAKNLELKTRRDVYAIVKASNIIIGID